MKRHAMFTSTPPIGKIWDALTPNQRRLLILDVDVAELERLVQDDDTMKPQLEIFRQKRATLECERPHVEAAVRAFGHGWIG